jgi:hypothetical protein
MSRVAAETSRANAMVLTSDHAAQPGKVTFGAVDVDTVEETVSIGMVDPLKVEIARELVPMRRLVGDELGAPCFRSCEAHRLGFVLENVRQRAAIALAYAFPMGTSETSPTPESEEIATLKALNAAQAARIAILEEQLRLAAVKAFAPKSEKLSALAQMDLFNEAERLDVNPEVGAQATEIAVPAHARARGKRKPIDAKLPRVRVEHDIPDDQKTCPCGCQLTRIGEVASEQFDLVPARAQVL